jgi:SAM-dependent methyltransferase
VRRLHFELLSPLCPVCRLRQGVESQLALEEVFSESADDVVEGLLRCPSPSCRHEFPIIDGIPMIVPRLRELVAAWIDRIRARHSFSEPIESLLRDCCGPGSSFHDEHQRLSGSMWDHWGDCDPAESQDGSFTPRPGSVVRLLHAGLTAADASSQAIGHQPILDIGCAAGRTTLELAARLDRPTVGIDLDISILQHARAIRDAEQVSYPRRRIGIVYDRRSFSVRGSYAADTRGLVDYWCCDATALPFRGSGFGLAVSLNNLDCVSAPLAALQEMIRTLAPAGKAVVATPYDWSSTATPVEGWIGGHSQRSELRGAGDRLLRELLHCDGHPSALEGVRIIAERPAIPWHVRLHERSTVQYLCDLIALEKIG